MAAGTRASRTPFRPSRPALVAAVHEIPVCFVDILQRWGSAGSVLSTDTVIAGPLGPGPALSGRRCSTT